MARRRQLRLDQPVDYQPDDNVASYDASEDARNAAGERIRYVPIGRIHPSRHQTRLVQSDADDRLLAEDIDANGLIHPPLLRPHPTHPDAYEIVAGHRRVAALRRLAKEGRGDRVLRGPTDDPTGRRIPALVEPLDDLAAHSRTVSENLVRRDLSAWEQALALHRHQRALEASGARASVRGVAADLGEAHQTIAPYLQAARAITPDVLEAAGLTREDQGTGSPEPDHASLARLSLEALRRVARASEDERARVLRREVGRASGSVDAEGQSKEDLEEGQPAGSNAPRKRERDQAKRMRERGFQVNIRQPLGDLSAKKARRYLTRLLGAAEILAEAAADGQTAQRTTVAGCDVLIIPTADTAAPERVLHRLEGAVDEGTGE